MKIGILGAGPIGASLGRLWASAGHKVMFATRHPEMLEELAAKAGNDARTGTVDEAMEFGEVLVDALPFKASVQVSRQHADGKIMITASNYYPKERDGEINLEGLSQSEFVASRLPDTHVVKAFNIVGGQELEGRADGKIDQPLAVYYAGDNAEANVVAEQLIRETGMVPVPTGGLATGALFQHFGPLYAVRYSEERAVKELEACQAAQK